MHKILTSLLLLLCACPAFSQSDKDYKANRKQAKTIQLDKERYISAIGIGSDLKSARSQALAGLSGQISSNVSDEFNYIGISVTEGDSAAVQEKVNNIVRTYTSAILSDTKELVLYVKNGTTVLYYMLNSDLDKIFENRKVKALDYVLSASTSERSDKIGAALSGYYAALSMLRSLPYKHSNESEIKNLYNSVDDILSNISFSIKKTSYSGTERILTIAATYKGTPVSNLNFTYFNGTSRSEVCTIKNGEGEIIVPKTLGNDKLDVHIEYVSDSEANTDRELKSLIANTDPVPFHTSIIKHIDESKQIAFNPTPVPPVMAREPVEGATSTSTSSSKSKSKSTSSSKPKTTFDYASWTGKIKNGKPDGEGKMTFTKWCTIPGTYIPVKEGDVFEGGFYNGNMTNGELNGEYVEQEDKSLSY